MKPNEGLGRGAVPEGQHSQQIGTHSQKGELLTSANTGAMRGLADLHPWKIHVLRSSPFSANRDRLIQLAIRAPAH
jgi:hypothetical protein